MKWIFKFFIWRVTIKTEKLGEEEKVKYLANELVKAIQNSGKQIALPDIAQGFGSFSVNIHAFGTKNEKLDIECRCNGWEITTKPTFKKLEVK